jgi:tetratricopeptide (TPR) repeat protein
MSRRYVLVAGTALLALLALTYSDVRTHAFVNLDDDLYVYRNPVVREGLSASGVQWAFTTTSGGHYHPFTWLSLMVDVSLYGVDAARLALSNVMHHAAVSGLVFVWLLALTGAARPSLVAAALFALHPTRVESVAWVTERKDVLSSLFGFASLWLFVAQARQRQVAQRASLLVYAAASVVCFACALLAKPTWVVLPGLLLLLTLVPFSTHPLPAAKTVRWLAPFAVLSLAASAWTLFGQAREHAIASSEAVPLLRRLAEVPVNAMRTLGLFVWPVDLAVFYPRVESPVVVVALATLASAGLLVLIVWSRRTRPHVSFGLAWFLLAFIPVSGLVPAGGQSIADRFLYLPGAGLCILVAWELERLGSRMTASVLTSVIILGCAFLSARQVRVWKDSETLFRHALAVAPSFFAHNDLGVALDERGQLDAATEHYAASLQLNPGYPEANNNYGSAIARRGRFSEAIPYFSRAIAVRPTFARAHYHLGLARYSLLKQAPGSAADWAQARSALEAAVRLDPKDSDAQATLRAFIQERGPRGPSSP